MTHVPNDDTRWYPLTGYFKSDDPAVVKELEDMFDIIPTRFNSAGSAYYNFEVHRCPSAYNSVLKWMRNKLREGLIDDAYLCELAPTATAKENRCKPSPVKRQW
jgi:hypothetical protein